mgnify:CR=1 FL=1
MTSSDPVEIFRQESGELLDKLELGLLDLATRPGDMDLVDGVFRALHTLKGSGAMFGFTAAAAFLHDFETAFDLVRKGEAAASPQLITVALAARDHIATLCSDPDIVDPGGAEILAELRQAIAAEGPGEEAAVAAPATAAPSGGNGEGWLVRFRLPPDALVYGTNPILLLEELAGLGEARVSALLADVPPLESLDPDTCRLGWTVRLRTDQPREAIDDVFMFLRDSMELMVEPLSAPASPQDAAAALEPEVAPAALAETAPPSGSPRIPPEPAAPRRAAEPRAAPDKTSSLRVPAERLDALMDRVGEMVIAQARLNQVAAGSNDPVLKAVAEEMERLSAGLRDTTMGIRMLQIGTLFGRFRRLVHDLSGELGKEIEFVTSGEETELDKTMIEQLADPLVHLIRNAVDHGLEDAATRLASGKPAHGTVRLAADYAGAEVAITLSDDGAGLNAARIRARAEEAGLLQPDEPIEEAELFKMIFHAGFSTAREVTSLSGRGVGMDVVKRTIDGMRGSIDLVSTPGAGTTVRLRLPLTLAIVEGLLIRIGDERYSIPLAAVEECVELPQSADAGSKRRSFLNIRGSLVPFLRLHDLFGLETPPDEHQKVVIVSSGNTRVGLVVDQILGNQQTVIKQLSKLHASLKTFSGATILGDGTVALILDIMNLVDFGQELEARSRSEIGRAA